MTRSWASAALAVVAAISLSGSAAADDADTGLYGLIDAVAQRLQTADPVAAAKWVAGGPITDPARAEQVLVAISAAAESTGLPVDFVRRAFTDQINANEAIQYSRFAGWKLDPAGAPSSAQPLSASRDVIDRLNALIVTEFAQQLPVLRSAECPILIESARTGVVAARQLDDLYDRALEAATRSYCGG